MRQRIQAARRVFVEEGASAITGKYLRFSGNLLIERTRSRRKQKIVEEYDKGPRYLNVGGGDFLRDKWRVLDYYSEHYDYDKVFIDYPTNLEHEERWPIDGGSYDLVYSSATLEHLSQNAVEHTLRESHRILKSGGGLHITVPDVDVALRHYENEDLSWMREIRGHQPESKETIFCPEGYEPEHFLIRWIASTLINTEYDAVDLQTVRNDWDEMEKRAFLNKYTDRVRDEWQRAHPGSHRNWFDDEKLVSLLADAGFEEIKRVPARQSRFTELCHSQFDPRPQWSIQVEGVKP